MRGRIACAVTIVCVASAASVRAQSPSSSPTYDGRVSFGAEVSAAVSPADDTAFFNYTDYKHDTLRLTVAQVFVEWRASSSVSFLGELRSEDLTSPDVSALYMRWRPLPTHAFDIQVGRIPPVIGAYSRRVYGRDNPLISVPLAYQYLTSLRSDALPATPDDLLRMRARGWQASYPLGSATPGPGLPLMSGFHWDTGAEARWRDGVWDLSGALTRGSPAQPVVRDTNSGLMLSGRVGVKFISGLTAGVSAARGEWTASSVVSLLSPAQQSATNQTLVGGDVEFTRGAWVIRGEALRTQFEVPTLIALGSPLSASSAFVETRWQFLPRWQIGARADTLTFSDIRGTLFNGQPTPWDAPVHRIDVALGLRAARDVEVRFGWQQNWRDAGRVTHQGVPALQVLWWY